jgi:hypothetical protein
MAAPPDFKVHEIANDLAGGYQVIPIDMNHDGKIDLLALPSGMPQLVWFENPTWERHVIATDLPRMVNMAAADLDGDGIPEIVVARDFAMLSKDGEGRITLLKHNGDPREPWTHTDIDKVPTAHRLRFVDADGNGKKILVLTPLTPEGATSTESHGPNRVLFYDPADWKRQFIDENVDGLQHGITIDDWDHDGREETFISGFTGVHMYKRGKDGKWTNTVITTGDPDPWPKSGTSDVAIGHLGKEMFIAANEPWHGNEIVWYRKKGAAWNRELIDDSLVDGHTVVTGDFNGNKHDQIVAGFRRAPQRVYIYHYDGKKWNRTTLDEGIAAATCAVADLNGDGRPDIACIGMATHNLRWYENLGPVKTSQR